MEKDMNIQSPQWVMESLVRIAKEKAKNNDEIDFLAFVVDTMIAKNKGILEELISFLSLPPQTDILQLREHLSNME
jgi:hypothetical protein